MPTRRPSRFRRRTRFEALEARCLLATLGLDIRFLADDGGFPGEEISGGILRGEAFWVDVRVQDIRDQTAQGVIALPLNMSWDPALFEFLGDTNLTASGNSDLPLSDRLVTAQFPLQRQVNSYDAAAGPFDPQAASQTLLSFFNLRGVGGGALPNASQGSAIGEAAAESFSQLRFVALANDSSAPFTVNLDGSMSFADAAPLDDVAAIGNATEVTALANTVEASVAIVGGSIAGTKFNDANGNGVRDPGEAPIAGVTIQLTPTDPQGAAATLQSAADGSYAFTDLAAGSYSLSEIVPTNSVVTLPANNIYTVTLQQDNQVVEDRDFGNFQRTTLSGRVFNDLNANGTQESGEAGLPNATVRLDLGNDGSFEQTVTSGADGSYQFTDVGPGTHRVSETPPSGFVPTLPNPPSYTVANVSGTPRTDLNFGNRAIVDASAIMGFVYSDVDRDGVFDDGEVGLPGVTVQLFLQGQATPLQTVTTAADGSYSFTDLEAGTYRVVESQPASFNDASITRGTVLPGGQTRGATDGLNTFTGINLADNETAIDYNFGEVLAAVSKRMLLASTNVRAELCANLELACRAVQGTSGDDEIRVEHLTDDRLQITVNDAAPVVLSAQAADVVLVDGLGGQDSVTLVGNQQSEAFVASPSRLAMTTAMQRLGVFNVAQIRVEGGGGTDTAVLRDSPGADVLTASGNSAIMTSPNNQRIELIDIDTIDAVSAVDTPADQAQVAALDYVLQLQGDWT